jgi:hypothetical protein
VHRKGQLIVDYGQSLAACTALAVGGALVFDHAAKLLFGPWVPRIVGALIFLVAFGLAYQASQDLALGLAQGSGNRWARALFGGLIASVLQLVCIYFITAAVIAAIPKAAS